MKVAIVSADTMIYRKQKDDTCSPIVRRVLDQVSFKTELVQPVPNDREVIRKILAKIEDAQMAELIQGYLAGIGLTVTMDYVDPATLNSRIAEGNWDINLAGGSGALDMSLFWGNLYRKNDSGMSKYFHNDEALYNIFDAFNAIGGKTDENNQALYEYEAENVTWYPMFNKEVLYVYNSEYTNLVVNDAYMSLPYLGTLN